jgi:hypothetical protein
LLIRTVCAALVVPTFCENVRVLVVNLIAEGRGLGSGAGTAP